MTQQMTFLYFVLALLCVCSKVLGSNIYAKLYTSDGCTKDSLAGVAEYSGICIPIDSNTDQSHERVPFALQGHHELAQKFQQMNAGFQPASAMVKTCTKDSSGTTVTLVAYENPSCTGATRQQEVPFDIADRCQGHAKLMCQDSEPELPGPTMDISFHNKTECNSEGFSFDFTIRAFACLPFETNPSSPQAKYYQKISCGNDTMSMQAFNNSACTGEPQFAASREGCVSLEEASIELKQCSLANMTGYSMCVLLISMIAVLIGYMM